MLTPRNRLSAPEIILGTFAELIAIAVWLVAIAVWAGVATGAI